MNNNAYARKLASDEACRQAKFQDLPRYPENTHRAPEKLLEGRLIAIGFITWACFWGFALPASAEDDHRVQFHAQGGSLDKVSKDDTEIVTVSKEPVTKAEAISALDRLLDKLKKLRDNPKVVKADVLVAEELVPKMKDWVNRNGRSGIATGKSYSETSGNIRIDCEPVRGWVLVDNLPHSFQLKVSGFGEEVTRTWKNDDNPGRKVGRSEFESLKSEMFSKWRLDPTKANELKVRIALAAWKDARDWFENDVLRNGLIDGDAKSKSIDKEESDAGKREKITLKIEVKMLTGIGFIEED